MPQQKASLIPVLAVGFFAVVGMLYFEPVAGFAQVLTSWYEPCKGTISELVIAEQQVKEIEFTYTVDGRRHFGSMVSHNTLDLDEIHEEVGELRKGKQVAVYFDPQSPEKSVLVRGLTTRGQFGICWSSLAMLGFLAAGIQFRYLNRPKEKFKQGYEDRVEFEPGRKRLRMVPGGWSSPMIVGVSCFFGFLIVTYVVVEGGQRFFQWWQIDWETKAAISLAIATCVGVFDYFYTLRGNERGRWDLIINDREKTLQVPAIGAYGQPSTHPIRDIVGLRLQTLISPEASEGQTGIYRLKIVCQHHRVTGFEDVILDAKSEHTVAQSGNRTELEALAEWMIEAAGLPPEID